MAQYGIIDLLCMTKAELIGYIRALETDLGITENRDKIRRGKWIIPEADDEQVYCSSCGWRVYGDLFTRYCPGCGARMG